MSRRHQKRTAFQSLLATLLAIAALASPAHAQIGEGELSVVAGPTYAGRPHFASALRGMGFQAGAFYGVHPFVSIGAVTSASHLFVLKSERDTLRSSNVLAAFAGPSLTIDVIRWVPYLSLMPGVYWSDHAWPETSSVRFGLRGGLGVDCRINREWSAGVELDWHGMFPQFQDFPAYAEVWLKASYIFDLRMRRRPGR